MHKTLPAVVLFVLLSITGFIPQAKAQFAVIDVGAIVQLVQEVEQMEQVLQTAQNELNQAKQEYQSITGLRGMQNLLSNINRNYLPTTWAQLPIGLASPIQSQAWHWASDFCTPLRMLSEDIELRILW